MKREKTTNGLTEGRWFSLKKFVSSLKVDVTRLEKLELLAGFEGACDFQWKQVDVQSKNRSVRYFSSMKDRPSGGSSRRMDGQLRKSCWIAFNSGIFYSLWRVSVRGLTTAWAEFIHALVKLLTACGLTIDLLDLLLAGHRREKKPLLC